MSLTLNSRISIRISRSEPPRGNRNIKKYGKKRNYKILMIQ